MTLYEDGIAGEAFLNIQPCHCSLVFFIENERLLKIVECFNTLLVIGKSK